jgi:hypothetical protein
MTDKIKTATRNATWNTTRNAIWIATSDAIDNATWISINEELKDIC